MSLDLSVICLFQKQDTVSVKTGEALERHLCGAGYTVKREFDPAAELIVCVGGDGRFLKTVHACDFADIPYVGINTGHLGFFQDFQPDSLEEFVSVYREKRFVLQPLEVLCAEVLCEDGTLALRAVNEIVIRGTRPRTIHLDLSIGDSRIQRFSGDGLLISTPAGSTAYNYSLGGAIADPRLSLLQVTPISPMNTVAYRCFTSSVLLPSDLSICIEPELGQQGQVMVVADGAEEQVWEKGPIKVQLSSRSLRLLRLENYHFWNKVKSKFL